MTGILDLIFELQMHKGVISPPVKGFYYYIYFDHVINCLKTSHVVPLLPSNDGNLDVPNSRFSVTQFNHVSIAYFSRSS